MDLRAAAETGTDVSVVSGLYSQLAGVLAGFAFAALVLIFTLRLDPAKAHNSSYIAFVPATRLLMVAFLGLVTASINYATLAGDKTLSVRTSLIQVLFGLAFSVAGLILVYAIALVFVGAHAAAMRRSAAADLLRLGSFVRGVLAVVVVPFLLVLVYLGFQDFQTAQNRATNGGIIYSLFDIACGLLLLVQIGFAIYYSRASSQRERRAVVIEKVSVVAVSLIFVPSLIGHTVSAVTNERTESLAAWMAFVVVCVGFMFGTLFQVHLTRSKNSEMPFAPVRTMIRRPSLK